MLEVNAGLVNVPDVLLVPVHAPDDVQLVAPVDDHVSFVVPPEATVVGDAEKDNVGAGVVVPDTVTVLVTDLYGADQFLQLMPYVRVAVSGPVDWEPLSGLVPVHPFVALQFVALVTDQESVELLPDAMLVGDAEKLMTGAATTDTVLHFLTLPPGPVHTSV